MAAVYGTIASHQVTLADNTTKTVTLPTLRTPALRMTISSPYKSGHSSRTAPVCFIFRPAGSTTEPTTVLAGADGACSPCLPPQVAAVEVAQIPADAVAVALKTTEGGEVWVQFYEVAL